MAHVHFIWNTKQMPVYIVSPPFICIRDFSFSLDKIVLHLEVYLLHK